MEYSKVNTIYVIIFFLNSMSGCIYFLFSRYREIKFQTSLFLEKNFSSAEVIK